MYICGTFWSESSDIWYIIGIDINERTIPPVNIDHSNFKKKIKNERPNNPKTIEGIDAKICEINLIKEINLLFLAYCDI